ncbi:MAG: UDP-3-O-[3-hydroxymyristoyl] N-acetylglucosamine deacetylase [Planctomycetes bacterium]|nr:UDP-3-O-[3-hydroxymyristoyl] N-acetylglucosamine deacetylase [Planctomycetota bacterium]
MEAPPPNAPALPMAPVEEKKTLVSESTRAAKAPDLRANVSPAVSPGVGPSSSPPDLPRAERTLQKPVQLSGAGLFLGRPATARILPGAPSTGIVFVRTDLPDRPRIPATPDNVFARPRRTSLGKEGREVETVEHLLAAFAGLGLDNLEVELSGPEVPAGDGSAKPWTDLLASAGIAPQPAPRKVFEVREPISVLDGEASLVALPAKDGLTLSVTADHAPGILPAQALTFTVEPAAFVREIAPARTFCLQAEAEALLAQGQGKGGTTQNTLVIGADGRPLENQFRFADEFVRHKVLDLLGDLSLLGAGLRAHVVAVRSGHVANLLLVRKLARAMDERRVARTAPKETLLDVRELLKILPHRYPFLLIDKVIELDSYRRAVGIKNVTFNEPYFQGHFPGKPIMPGVLQLEAMAQLAGALLMRKADNQSKLAVLLAIDKVKFRKTVVPGDQLRIEAEAVKIKNRTGVVHTKATVDGQLVTEALLKFMLVDAE